ncbi:multidrug effflux MFS transporter [Mesonia sp. K7]|uniref:multidrug effflux MFS transporter n=1 Tax=Mesonia sp. K7 TaxID=2218606 RepID=UPI000DAA0AED|nr:multidrug effflux MFS transporter [Mesonia sp. K7]PZD77003.1 Bcr/CflA family drug resistance efflux transporter [Mesonia sp. K7]
MPQISKKQEKIVLFVLGTMIALGPFSIDMYLPGFDYIADEFSVKKADVGLSLTSYFIGIALGQLVYGPLMDKFGRKKPLLIGLLIYFLAALSCAYSPNLMWLVVSRFFLAMGASAGMVAARAVVRDVFPPEEVARAISFLMLIMGGAPIIAPTVGSMVIAHFSWHIIFVVLALFCFVIFISVSSFLPESIVPDKTVELKLTKITKKYYEIMTDKVFMTFSLAGGFTIGALFSYITFAPTLFLDEFNLTETQFGWFFGLNAAGLIAGSQMNRVVLKRNTTFYVTKVISVLLVLVGALLLLNTFSFNNFYITLVLLFTILFLLGFQNPNTTALSLFPFTQRAGRASALVGSLKMGVGAMVSFIISSFFTDSVLFMSFVIFICLLISGLLIFRFQTKYKDTCDSLILTDK